MTNTLFQVSYLDANTIQSKYRNRCSSNGLDPDGDDAPPLWDVVSEDVDGVTKTIDFPTLSDAFQWALSNSGKDINGQPTVYHMAQTSTDTHNWTQVGRWTVDDGQIVETWSKTQDLDQLGAEALT